MADIPIIGMLFLGGGMSMGLVLLYWLGSEARQVREQLGSIHDLVNSHKAALLHELKTEHTNGERLEALVLSLRHELAASRELPPVPSAAQTDVRA